MESIQMQIKNTFVHLDLSEGTDAHGAERRSASVPRSLRLATTLCSAKTVCEEDKITTSSVRSAEASTEAEFSEGGSTIADLTPPPSPEMQPRQPSMVYAHAVALISCPVPQPPPFGHAAAAAGPTPLRRLNSKAQAWTPGGVSRGSFGNPQSTMMGFFLQRLAAVVSATAGAVRSGCEGSVVEATESPAGWSLIAELPLADFQESREKALAVACQALLQTARSTQGVHVLGSMASPFVATPFGCTAMVGAVCNEDQACWDALARGFCHRGHACRWEHPACRTTVNIMVKIASESK